MKAIYPLLFCLMCTYVYSQEYGFKKREIRKLERFGIAVKNFDLENDEVATDFRTILELDRKQKSARALGLASILPAGILIILGPAFLLSTGEVESLFAATLPAFVGIAGIFPIASLLASARDSKNERDRLIYKYSYRLQ